MKLVTENVKPISFVAAFKVDLPHLLHLLLILVKLIPQF
ncbi:hypothetical protein HNR31_000595 [Anoxybacillus caldiproteolyticus]|uniref:Uncharacterized protein n=1 Tax=Thermaerobacillus caldiproteolyticus TaxID=247480 RepID=A0A7V9Z4D0_9BACL|nr:hypothetical protein [Anoxybacillus caldiproteolyticus]